MSRFARRPDPSSGPDPAIRAGDGPPTIVAELRDGPLRGARVEVETVEGRPPKTVDLAAPDGAMCRYCLAEWSQAGGSAAYSFLYPV